MNDRLPGGARIVAKLRTADGKGIVHIEAQLNAKLPDVWSALIDPTRLGAWLGEITGDLRRGGLFQARFFASGWEGSGRVEICEPSRRLLVLMRESDGTSEDATDVKLRSEREQVVFVVEQRGLPPDQLAAYGAGLQLHLEDLAAYLGGGERCDARARWKELFPVYTAMAVDPS